MSVIRVNHNRENPFVQLNRSALWDENLSLRAIGLWARCMSRPDDWTFRIRELIKTSKEGRTAIYTTIDELIKHGYCIRMEIYQRVQKGQFGTNNVEYVFFEFPITESERAEYVEEFKKRFPRSGFRNPGNRDTGNQHILIDIDTNRDINTHTPPNPLEDKGEATGVAGVVDEFELKGTSEEEPQKPTPKIPDKPKSNPKRPHRSGDHDFEHCMLTDEEYHKLTEKLGDKERDYWINEINEAAEQTGPVLFNNGGKGHKPHKSHYLTILSWKRWRDENRSTSRQVPKTGGIPPKLSVVATLRSRLEPKGYTHQAAFAKIEIFSSTGHTVAKFSESDHDGIERWLQEKGL